MPRRLNFRLTLVALLLLAFAAVLISRGHRPSLLRPGLRRRAYVSRPTAAACAVPRDRPRASARPPRPPRPPHSASRPRQIIPRARPGRRPWLARLPPD